MLDRIAVLSTMLGLGACVGAAEESTTAAFRVQFVAKVQVPDGRLCPAVLVDPAVAVASKSCLGALTADKLRLRVSDPAGGYPSFEVPVVWQYYFGPAGAADDMGRLVDLQALVLGAGVPAGWPHAAASSAAPIPGEPLNVLLGPIDDLHSGRSTELVITDVAPDRFAGTALLEGGSCELLAGAPVFRGDGELVGLATRRLPGEGCALEAVPLSPFGPTLLAAALGHSRPQ